jgi:hypothetical protein
MFLSNSSYGSRVRIQIYPKLFKQSYNVLKVAIQMRKTHTLNQKCFKTRNEKLKRLTKEEKISPPTKLIVMVVMVVKPLHV